MKYEQIRNLQGESFRQLTGVKRQTFEKMVKILAEDDKNKKIKGRELIVRIVSILVKMAQRKN